MVRLQMALKQLVSVLADKNTCYGRIVATSGEELEFEFLIPGKAQIDKFFYYDGIGRMPNFNDQ